DLDCYDVEDAAADIAIMTVAGIDKAYGADTFRGFVYGNALIVRHRMLRISRERKKWAERERNRSLPPDPPQKEELEALKRCMDRLPDRQRRAVELGFM